MTEQLVERIRNHDQRAMGQLYQRYVGMLSSVCYRYVPAEDDAKDVLQNSFIKIFRSISTFDYRGENAFKGWMARVVVNEALNFLKEKKKVSFVEQDMAHLLQIPDEEDLDIEYVSPEELHQAVRELPDGYRMVINLYVFEGCPHKKIAEMLGIREATSASQLFRAKQLLARKIKEIMKGKQ